MPNKVFKISYHLKWMQPGDIRHMFFHGTDLHIADPFIAMLEKGTTWEVTESSLKEELEHFLAAELRADDFTNTVEGIDDYLVTRIIEMVRDAI